MNITGKEEIEKDELMAWKNPKELYRAWAGHEPVEMVKFAWGWEAIVYITG